MLTLKKKVKRKEGEKDGVNDENFTTLSKSRVSKGSLEEKTMTYLLSHLKISAVEKYH